MSEIDYMKVFKKVEHLVPEHNKKYVDIGHQTTPFDEDAFAEGMQQCYKNAGLDWHGRIVWVDNPVTCIKAGCRAGYVLEELNSAGRLDESLRRPDSGSDVDAAILEIVEGLAGGYSSDVVLAAAYSREADQYLKENRSEYLTGNMWISWPAYTNFITEVMGVQLEGDCNQRAAAYEKISSNAGLNFPDSRFVAATRAPVELCIVDGNLHSESGPALKWRDGYSLHFWNGVKVPEWVITGPTVERVFAESNQEIRRCAIESLGWENLVDHMTVIDRDTDPEMGVLYALDAGVTEDEVRVLIVRNGSRHPNGEFSLYGLTVPDSIGTVVEAQNWKSDLPLDYDYGCNRT